MRKREIHSVAHWAMMFLLLMFPLLMVAISVFQKPSSESQVHYDDITDVNQLIIGHEYYFNNRVGVYTDSSQHNTGKVFYNEANVLSTFNVNAQTWFDNGNNFTYYYNNQGISIYISYNATEVGNFTVNQSYGLSFTFVLVDFDSNALSNNFSFLKSVQYSAVDYRSDVNLWIDDFIDLPINSWYKSLMTVIGVGFTNSSVMNVIYVMPVYILWVFIFDVVVDCFLVIIKLPHKLLNRLSGGENE